MSEKTVKPVKHPTTSTRRKRVAAAVVAAAIAVAIAVAILLAGPCPPSKPVPAASPQVDDPVLSIASTG